MTSFRIALSMLIVLGCLRPITWTSSFKKFVYLVYTVMAYSLLQSVLLTHLLDLIFNVRSQKDFSENVYIMTSVTGGVFKMTMLLVNRKNIVVLLNALRKEPFLPVDDEETDIKSRLDKIIDMNSIQFMGAIQITMMAMWISTPILQGKNRKLAFRAWFPYNYSSPTLYTVTYLYQAVALTFETSMHVACDTLFSGMLICIYGQLEILGHRLQQITNDEGKSVIQCARHHHKLYVYAASVNKTFHAVLFFQMIMSVSMVCFSIFQLSQTRLSGRMIENFMLMFCPLLQIFYYCWYGNEVKRKSLEVSDMIFASNWMSLDKNTKRILLVIMLRSTYPMEFKSAHIMHVNVESFMAVIKTSYSAYNVLTRG
ncbi:odorant receptor Or1-like isoform X2 [Halictus rubicundus]|uniref:odorant receptor Or1-like isoform X2 n=1 Tax=Halictus rubicundus TaxID=77578 RepID=UPI0040355E43